ncbi:MAG: hypothetical protein IKN91_03160 [Paludibacteraceae bacterium]|nr:hypothetical protein [Paludibacteraceae bacterium]
MNERLRKFLDLEQISVRQFEAMIGSSDGKIAKFMQTNSSLKTDTLNKIMEVFPRLSIEWLITGEGSMLKTNVNDTTQMPSRDSAETVPTTTSAQNEQQPAKKTVNYPQNQPLADAKLIPLVTPTAVAGFGNDTFAIQEADVKEYYIVPKFRYNRVDFMIEISGSSMYPKYSSGDVVACTILHDSSFIQWNKCHVIATREQGLLCKRLMQSDTADALRLVSDNPNYPPFDVPKSEITGIALVIGVIRLE